MHRVFLAILSAAGGIGLTVLALAQTPDSKNQASQAPPAMEFVKISPGDFVMGCSTGDNACTDEEKPAHPVKLTKGFEIGKYEVTQAQWQAVMGSNPSTIKGDDRPVETVSKEEAEEFFSRLNARNNGYKYRLPTEAEWEYAARAGSAGPPPPLDEIAWYSDNSGDETHPVGQKKPNAWGIYDMFGNVREWVADSYARYTADAVTDPTGPAAGQGGRGRGGRGRGGRGGRRGGFFGPPPDGPPPNGDDPDVRGGPPPDGPPDGPQAAGENPGRFRGGPGGRPGGFGRGGRDLPVVRGGGWDNGAAYVRVSARYHYYGPTLKVSDIGFRAVRVPVAQ